MRLDSENGDFVELNRQHDDAADVFVTVSVSRAGFAATAEAWILAEAWHSFAQQLSVLEERRQGEARVESISPGELLLVVKSADRAGHLGVEGHVGTRTYDTDVSMRFSMFAFDPSQLAAFASQARDISADVAALRRTGA
jgi:hypothetical protein